MKILLDNGHGINTPGKRSPIWNNGKQLFEWEFNRDIVKRISVLLKTSNIEYEIIVPEDIDISLSERANRINMICQKNNNDCLALSIHGNAGPQPNTGTGWEVYHYPTSKKGKEYAEIFSKIFDESNIPFRNRGVKTANFAILHKTICPTILTENLFFDNEKDCEFMMSDKGRDSIASLHYNSIIQSIKL